MGVKASQLPADSAPTGTDYLILLDTETNTLKKVLVSDLFSQGLIGASGLANSAVLRNWQIMLAGVGAYTVTGSWSNKVRNANGTDNPVELSYESSAQNDEASYKVYLEAGTYSVSVLADKDINRGIIQLRIDGANSGSTLDCYAGSRTNSLYGSLGTGITVATSGLKVVSVKAATKNASSIGYIMSINRIIIVRTA